MSVLVSTLVALFVAVGLIAGSRFWFNRIHHRRLVRNIGIEVLSSRHWREGMGLIVRALEADGYVAAADAPAGAPTGEKLLRKGGSSALLVYKHGTAYSIGAAALRDAERRRQETEADEVLLATLGSVEPEALAQAGRMQIHCLDGDAVWRLAEPLLEPATREGVLAEADSQVARPRTLATAGAAVLGLAIVVWGSGLLSNLDPGTPAPMSIVATPAAPALPAAPAAPTASTMERPAAGGNTGTPADAPSAPRTNDPAARRAELAAALIALPEFGTAVWSSNTTLVLTVRARFDAEAAVAKACDLAGDYPELREVRLQVEAGQDVRWRRCA